MNDHIPKDAMKAAAEVSRESGQPLDDILHAFTVKRQEVKQKRTAPEGKFRILGVDKYDNSDWVHGDYEDMETAVSEARRLTTEAKKDVFVGISSRPNPGHDIATVYYAYNDRGEYLGGDTWVNE